MRKLLLFVMVLSVSALLISCSGESSNSGGGDNGGGAITTPASGSMVEMLRGGNILEVYAPEFDGTYYYWNGQDYTLTTANLASNSDNTKDTLDTLPAFDNSTALEAVVNPDGKYVIKMIRNGVVEDTVVDATVERKSIVGETVKANPHFDNQSISNFPEGSLMYTFKNNDKIVVDNITAIREMIVNNVFGDTLIAARDCPSGCMSGSIIPVDDGALNIESYDNKTFKIYRTEKYSYDVVFDTTDRDFTGTYTVKTEGNTVIYTFVTEDRVYLYFYDEVGGVKSDYGFAEYGLNWVSRVTFNKIAAEHIARNYNTAKKPAVVTP